MPSPRPPLCRALPLVFAVALLAACGQSAPPAPMAPPPAEVTVVTLQPQTVTLTRELPGRTSPFLVAEVRPQVGGIIKNRLFTEGSHVTAGQPLYQLDDALPRADQETAKAALARAQAALNAARPKAARWAELAATGNVSKQDNENMIAALRRLLATQELVDTRSAALASFKIAGRRGFLDLISTHPPLQQRIAALEEGR